MTISYPAGAGLLSYRFGLTSDAEVMICTVGLDIPVLDPDPQGAVDSKADAFAAAVTPANISTGYTFLGCRLQMGPSTGGGATYEAPRSVVGTADPLALPNNCAFLIKKITELGGRRGRGRMYLPPFVIDEADVDQNGMLSGATQASLQALVDDAFPLEGLRLFHDDTPSPIDPTVITALLVDRQIATQRRRLR